MEAFVGPIWDIIQSLCSCTANTANVIKDLERNVEALENAMKQLKDIREDVTRRVVLEEERQMVRTNQVNGWLQRVEATEKSVDEFLEKARQKRNFCTCCWMRYKLGKEVVVKQKDVEKLKGEGVFDCVAEALPCGVADERPLGHTVGLDSALALVNGWIEDDNVRIMGIYGMGGVGKTTLLKRVHNLFPSRSRGFDKVIWVVVSKPSSIGKVQDMICEELNISKDKWRNKDEDEKGMLILRILRTKKFVLMLDDIWSWLDLVKVGVLPALDGQRISKIVFTTRYESICDSMKSDRKLKIGCLDTREAMALFMQQVGTEIIDSHPSIRKSAEIVVQECDGLPLALITVGRAMAGKKVPRDWDMAVKKLRRDPSKMVGIEDHVFHILKFSYDSLPSDTIRLCFSYCCIFPEDYEILIEDLLDLWIGEGFLKEYDDVHEARDRGRDIIEDLKAASLLEIDNADTSVKMHDVIRDMALWISNGLEKSTKRYLVLDHIDLVEVCATKMESERVSLWGETIKTVTSIQPWKNTWTFMMRSTRVRRLPFEFLQCMFMLKVLDLSNNEDLVELPSSIGELVQLEFLNLFSTSIKELPTELKNSTKMKHLLLDYTSKLEMIPRQVISSFPLLRTFRLYNFQGYSSDVDAKDNNILSGGLVELLELLEAMPHISSISFTLSDANSIKKLNKSPKLLSCLRILYLHELISLESLSFSADRMRHLELIAIEGCKVHEVEVIIDSEQQDRSGVGIYQAIPEGCFHNLNEIRLVSCCNLLDLWWLVYAPMLQYLLVSDCRSMIEIVTATATGHDSINLFSRLKDIYLYDLPCLQSVSPCPLPFPSLVKISVGECPRLKRLPLDWTSGRGGLKTIRGESVWWDTLQWEDQMLQPHFRQYFELW
ncbi:probable disease resistance protein At5g63020 [Andrographis paniculata]|uniref:probable disease resistance protein At5g63020 n=1 Tax=Andrographis paniculata TaxID=175694 RepID=UPI0021E92B9A|nr:probable disease resistance protein At5g63020 [Andrographis paniculata]XP_051127534.1 probable disease resistance protein At5g63020 [Andrographis paniculata]XP_051127535.1 probable disease resistance protein At5g63020 [Andrographis paniculata]XP_051127536.1 probable disease resistance protein At5g63020 [Andrographis paniculata]